MARLALIAALALACSAAPESAFPDTSGLYSVQGSAVSCPGAQQIVEPARVECEWTCLHMDGRDVRWLGLTFSRADASSAWQRPIDSWDFNGFEAFCL